jgi:hypothetical protein
MKAFLFGLLFLVLVGVGGYIGLKYFYKPPTVSQVHKVDVITKIGILRKSTLSKSDFTHVIITPDASVGVASFSLNLDDYIGKNVSVSGQFSGDTLFADTITIVP